MNITILDVMNNNFISFMVKNICSMFYALQRYFIWLFRYTILDVSSSQLAEVLNVWQIHTVQGRAAIPARPTLFQKMFSCGVFVNKFWFEAETNLSILCCVLRWSTQSQSTTWGGGVVRGLPRTRKRSPTEDTGAPPGLTDDIKPLWKHQSRNYYGIQKH